MGGACELPYSSPDGGLGFRLPVVEDAPVAHSPAHRDLTACRRVEGGPEVCAGSANVGYLLPAAEAVAEVYRTSPYPGELPRRVAVVDSAFVRPVGPVAGVGLSLDRGLRRPRSLDVARARESLVHTVSGSCPEADHGHLRAAFGISGATGDAADVRRTLAGVRDCLAG